MTNNRSYKEVTKKNLFLLSRGLCEFCETPIMFVRESERGTTYQNICEVAHISALNKTAARYDPDIPLESLNEIDNLMILCPNCHKKIDKMPTSFSTDYLKHKKEIFESETISQAVTLLNKTEIGGHKDYINGKKLINFFSQDDEEIDSRTSIDDLKHKEDSSNADFYQKALLLIEKLNDLALDSRSALLMMSKQNDNYMLSDTYWYSAISEEQMHKIIEPLRVNNFIDIDEWYEGEQSTNYATLTNQWEYLVSFFSTNDVDLSELIIQRDYTVFDEE